jgi:cytochrome c2
MRQLILFLLLLTPFGLLNAEPDAEAGKDIFKKRCSSCHNFKQDLTGPALMDVHLKREEDWIIKFVQSSQEFIASGDQEAKAIYAKFNTVMPDHKDLSADDVRNIIAFIEVESKRVKEEAASNPIKRPKELVAPYLPLTWSDHSWMFLVYGFLIAMLVVALNIVFNATDLKKKMNKN